MHRVLAVLAFPALLRAQASQAPGGAIKIVGDIARLHVTGPRALADAIYATSRAFNVSAGFEEVKPLSPHDILDVTSPKYVPASKDDRAFKPRGGTVDVSFKSPAIAARTEDLRTAVTALLNEYHRLGLPGRYAFEITSGSPTWLYVYPVEVTGPSGHPVKVAPVSRAAIELTPRDDEKPFDILLDALNAAAGASNDSIKYGGMLGLGFQGGLTKPAVLSGPAYVIFNAISDAAGRHFWALLYEPSPSWKNYFFSFQE